MIPRNAKACNEPSFPDRKPIDPVLLRDRLRSASIFRNRCVDHVGVTHRKFPFELNAPTVTAMRKAFVTDGSDLRTFLLVIAILIPHIAPTVRWRDSLHGLLERTTSNLPFPSPVTSGNSAFVFASVKIAGMHSAQRLLPAGRLSWPSVVVALQ